MPKAAQRRQAKSGRALRESNDIDFKRGLASLAVKKGTYDKRLITRLILQVLTSFEHHQFQIVAGRLWLTPPDFTARLDSHGGRAGQDPNSYVTARRVDGLSWKCGPSPDQQSAKILGVRSSDQLSWTVGNGPPRPQLGADRTKYG